MTLRAGLRAGICPHLAQYIDLLIRRLNLPTNCKWPAARKGGSR
jgi:hypothetical protein